MRQVAAGSWLLLPLSTALISAGSAGYSPAMGSQPPTPAVCHGGLLQGSWSYLPPTAFDGSTDKHNPLAPAGWSNQACLYNFTVSAAAPADGSGSFSFTSPPGCLSDWWKPAPAVGQLLDEFGGLQVDSQPWCSVDRSH
jgi:hypothetical protein